MDNRQTLTEFMEKTEFPREAWQTFLDLDARLCGDPACAAKMDELISRYHDAKIDRLDETFQELAALGEKLDLSPRTLQMYYFMRLAPTLREHYRERGISGEIFWDSMRDLRAKVIECYNGSGVWGSAVNGWFRGFFELTRFALGRLQFEEVEYTHDDYTKNGVTVREGDKAYNMHIPSLGPLTPESVQDAFRRAYRFFRPEGGAPLAYVCSSWLLYPRHYEFLPQGNILKFMDCFDIIDSVENAEFGDGWRVFGKHFGGPTEALPEDTSMRRAFKKWLLDGNCAGSGFGVIVFDGEKILNK